MLVSLWLTSECNMACGYCYEGLDKTNKSMSTDTADKSIEFILDHFRSIDDDKLIINFHGGEPLLEFQLMKYITEKFKKIFNSTDERLLFGTTTNGLLLNEEIAAYLCENFHYSLSVSIDGEKSTHDANRVMKNGIGSYDLVMDKFLYLLSKRSNVRARMTFNSSTVHNLYDNVKHLVDSGFEMIIPGMDYFDKKWDSHHIGVLEREMEKIQKLIQSEKINNPKLDVGMVNEKVFQKNACSGGVTTLNIDMDGNIYPCSYVVENKDYIIGDINIGIDKEKLAKILQLSHIQNEACIGCTYQKFCNGTRCKLINKVLTDDYNKPSPVMCAVENLVYKFSKKIQ